MIEATITTRGLIGFEIDVVNATSGRGVMSHLFKEYGPYAGDVLTRLTGTILATEAGVDDGLRARDASRSAASSSSAQARRCTRA